MVPLWRTRSAEKIAPHAVVQANTYAVLIKLIFLGNIVIEVLPKNL